MVFIDLFQFLFNSAISYSPIILLLIATCVLSVIVCLISYLIKGRY